MIEFQNVSKVYSTAQAEVRAIDDLTLRFDAGEFVAVRGHSGSGKSTLLSLVGGLTLPTSGTVRVADQDIGRMSASKRAQFRAQNIGFVFQLFHLLPYLNVLDNVVVAADRPDAAVQEEARRLLDQFDLNDRLGHRPSQLSAGERQRVAMARALLNRPKLLLADEPTGNLDPKNAESLLELLAEYHASGGTILLVTHDDQAASFAQRTVSLERGAIEVSVP